MSRLTPSFTVAVFLSLMFASVAQATITAVPEPFKGANEDSTYRINYDDLSKLLRLIVVDTGQSSRQYAAPPVMRTGTRLRKTVNRATVNEGNRLYYEMFQGNDQATALLQNIKTALEDIPSQVSLQAFSRNEQLAYWLNLYNITLIDEVAKIYPKHNLQNALVGDESILTKKTLKVAGTPLSLNDIEFILWKNFDADPLVVYGLYQGVIGGPNIRRAAYTGKNVHRSLKKNAVEFINSNRGTRMTGEETFRVSSFYVRETPFFDSDQTLKQHLLRYLESPESEKLRSANEIERNINDWSTNDLYGSKRNLAASMASNRAALLNAVQGSHGGGSAVSASSSVGVGHALVDERYSPDLVLRLHEINARRMRTAEKNATVTVEELGTVEVDSENSDMDGD